MNSITTISPKAAHKLLQDNPQAILIDVRSSMEFLMVGHPVGAINVPWIDEPDWKINPNFATEVRKLLLGGICYSEDVDGAPVLLICRSGKRSLDAGLALIKDGFRDVYNVEYGFEGPLDGKHHRSTVGGWRCDELPWEQC